MKVYLASRFGRQAELRGYRDQLVVIGHVVTSRWLDDEHQAGDHGIEVTDEENARFAEVDRSDLMSADLVVSFTEPATTAPARGGRHVEFGLALASGKALLVVGHRENVFHFLPEVPFAEDWTSAQRIIADLAVIFEPADDAGQAMNAMEREAARGVNESRGVTIVSVKSVTA